MTTREITDVHLARGGHSNPEAGLCLLEAVAYVAGEQHSDHPACTSLVLGTFGRSLNDVLPDDRRQELKPLVAELIGTRGDGHDETRSLMALDWLVRTWLPAWLDLAKLDDQARAARDLAQIVDLHTAQAAGPIVRAAREKSAAAGDAAWAAARAAAGAAARAAAGDAAGDAAWAAAGAAAGAAARAAAGDAAWDAAGAAAGDAARAAAGAAAGDAAWAAAGDAAGAAAGDAAGAAAGDAAWDAAWAAAGDAAGAAAGDAAGAAAGDAAGAAARAALQPTVDQLQTSAIDLYTRMIRVGVNS